jgi:hypothetical protein
LTGFNAVQLEMTSNACFVEGLHAKAEVIQVARLRSWRCTSSLAELAIDGHQIDEGSTGAQLNQADGILPTLHGAPQRPAIEAKHLLEVDYAQDEVVNFANVDHGECVNVRIDYVESRPDTRLPPFCV